MEYAAYASEGYLQRRGHPDLAGGSRGHCAIQQVGNGCLEEQSQRFDGFTLEATRSLLICSHEAAVGATLEGGGLACLASFRARKDRRLILLKACLTEEGPGLFKGCQDMSEDYTFRR